MKASVRDIIDATLRREGFGEFTNRAEDRGGPTKWGITLNTYRRFRENATIDDLRALTEEQARDIYWQDYVERPGFDRIVHPELRALMVDFGVTSGTVTAIKALQRALNVQADGINGVETRKALAGVDGDLVYASVLRQYFSHFAAIVVKDPSQLVWLRGWINRANEFIR